MIFLKKEVKKKENINEKLKIIKNKVKDFILKYYNILIISLPFILIDILTRILGYKIHFYGIGRLVPNLFTISLIFNRSVGSSHQH